MSTFANRFRAGACLVFGALLALTLTACGQEQEQPAEDTLEVNDVQAEESTEIQPVEDAAANEEEQKKADVDAAWAKLNISKDERAIFQHGTKTAEYQKYIVLHDTESEASASSVLDYWESDGKYIAAHFIINKDGSILQCIPLDQIGHHAGYGDTGHNSEYGVTDESRDDKRGTSGAPSKSITDYGMNSYSVGIEMVHVGGSGDYPTAQLEALDNLIAYIDAYYGSESTIIDHKAWRSGNSDTSAAFATYLANYQDHRSYK